MKAEKREKKFQEARKQLLGSQKETMIFLRVLAQRIKNFMKKQEINSIVKEEINLSAEILDGSANKLEKTISGYRSKHGI